MRKQNYIPVIEHTLKAYKTWYSIRDHLPKKSRYTLGDKIDARFVVLLELLYMASYQIPSDKVATLTKATTSLDLLKFLLRVSWEVGAMDDKKYGNLSEEVQNISKQIAGWKKDAETKTSG